MCIRDRRDHVHEKLSLEELCGEMKYSSSQFSMLFTRTTGHSPMDYFNQLKVQRACQYLDLTNLKIKEISFMLGFRDQFYFSRVFKKYMEMTPVDYKKRADIEWVFFRILIKIKKKLYICAVLYMKLGFVFETISSEVII